MRIAIDAREMSGRPTGVGRILSRLLAVWAQLPAAQAHEFVLCVPEGLTLQVPAGLPASIARRPGRGTLWQQIALPRLLTAAGADILYAPAYGGPVLARLPMVVSMFDVSFAAHPEWFRPKERIARQVIARLSAARAARVLTCSEFSKREIVRHLKVPPERVDVIYPGVTVLPEIAGPARSGEQTPGATPDEENPLVLYAGSLFNRRHLPEVVAGFERFAAGEPRGHLEIVGENRTLPYVDLDRRIAASPARTRIRARSYVSDRELADLYRRAAAFVFCSDYEGFGMTPMEALAVGIPIIVLDTAVTREVYGPAAHYVARPDPHLIAGAIARVLFDREERARILAAAPGVLARYSWEECGRRTLQILLASVA